MTERYRRLTVTMQDGEQRVFYGIEFYQGRDFYYSDMDWPKDEHGVLRIGVYEPSSWVFIPLTSIRSYAVEWVVS